MEYKKVYIGCGEDYIEGFIHVDIRPLKHVSINCKAWELSKHLNNIDFIYSRHMLEHLTIYEMKATLIDWLNILKENGKIQFVIPNLEYHCKQFLETEWDENINYDKYSDEIHSLSSIFGWQRESNPLEENYNNSYWDIHKYGYSSKSISYLLKSLGYYNIEIDIIDDIHLNVIAQKNLKANSINISSHRNNTTFAKKKIQYNLNKILDFLNNLDKKEGYLLFGYGTIGKIILPHIEKNIIAIIDNNLNAKTIRNIPIIKEESLKNYKMHKIINSAILYDDDIKNLVTKYQCHFIKINV